MPLASPFPKLVAGTKRTDGAGGAPRAVALDISRLVTRLDGRGLTGIDRVERAYLRHFAQTPRFCAFARLGRLFLIFDANRALSLLGLIEAAKPGPRLSRALSQSRLIARASCVLRPKFLETQLSRRLGHDAIVINVGHQFAALPYFHQMPSAVMIHDTIPLDHPEFTRDGIPARFAAGLELVAQNASLVIANSQATQDRAAHHLNAMGARAPIIIAPLGVEDPPKTAKASARASARASAQHPYFVQLGTIEPRKNHALTLGIWQNFWDEQGKAAPHLHIIGRRGWKNEAVFNTLDHAPFMGQIVFEHQNLSDTATQNLLAGAQALLFPTWAEGFGYPLFEARQLGIPIIASSLSVLKEFSDKQTRYIDPNSNKEWEFAITNSTKPDTTLGSSTKYSTIAGSSITLVPRWAAHFNIVSQAIQSARTKSA